MKDQNKNHLEASLDLAMHHIHEAKTLLQSVSFANKERLQWLIALSADIIRDADWVRDEITHRLCEDN